ncbi:inorganic phosphate transporter [Halocatena salina]|uniref:Phosphate transporter n=1 Tax=Halocatena salina TaxID=2934340 RepID=A0A8U0A069_9EURY|nr:inorganic phosphate transporter [Halocatena salina]UPM41798.1 inorganic phosphate transporter family protein [Halocatena salina]
MVTVGFLGIIVVASVASLFMAWTIGAGSSGSTPFAPAAGANVISVMRAGFLVGILGFAGAVFQGANVAGTVGTGLIRGVTLSPGAIAVGLFVAALLVSIGIFTGYPIPTGFTATGAVIGVGLAMGGLPAWETYREIGAMWVLVPFVGSAIAYVTARLLRHERIPERVSVPVLGGVVGAIIANMSFVFLGGRSFATAGTHWPVLSRLSEGVASVVITVGIGAVVAALLAWDMTDADRGLRHFLLVLGGLVAFSAGASQVGLAVGPLIPLLEVLPITLVTLLIGGGIGLLAGSWMGAPRMIKALAQDYSSLGPRRSIAALVPSFALAQTAVLYGIPVSFNEIILSAIIGSGFAAGGASSVSQAKMRNTVVAWIGSLVIAIAGSYGVYIVLQALL